VREWTRLSLLLENLAEPHSSKQPSVWMRRVTIEMKWS